jgi:hypothetical protein
MLDIKKNIRNIPQFILTVVSSLLAIVALIVYLSTGIIKGYTDSYSAWLIVFLSVGIIANVVTIAKRIDSFETLPFICYVISLILFFAVNANYLVAVVRAIDITSVSASFVITAILLVVAAVSEIVGVALHQPKNRQETASIKEQH